MKWPKFNDPKRKTYWLVSYLIKGNEIVYNLYFFALPHSSKLHFSVPEFIISIDGFCVFINILLARCYVQVLMIQRQIRLLMSSHLKASMQENEDLY